MPCFHPKLAAMAYDPVRQKYIVNFSHIQHGDQWEQIQVPCGKCLGCRADRAQNWAIRCQLEALNYPGKNWFVTLTYDDEQLPLCECAEVSPDGELVSSAYVPTLIKKHWQKFEKDLRNKFGKGIRFLACGEYGELSGRPHYHAIIFNFDLQDTKRFKVEDGNLYYTSKSLDDIWSKGHVLVAPYEFATGKYVAKYLCKSQYILPDGIIDQREPPFLLMSRRPGLGRQYYDDHKMHLLQFDKVTLPGEHGQGAHTVTQPRYFDYLLRQDADNLDQFLSNKKARRDLQKTVSDQQDMQSDKDAFKRLRDREETAENRKRARK